MSDPSAPQPDARRRPTASRPVEVADGLPDRAATPSRAIRAILAAIVLAWMGVLLYFQLAG